MSDFILSTYCVGIFLDGALIAVRINNTHDRTNNQYILCGQMYYVMFEN